MERYKYHFQPQDGYLGDCMPFYWDGEYHIFYLKASLQNKGVENLIWAHIKSNDLLSWEILPDVLPAGQKNAPDEDGCWSGSVVHDQGKFYIFYTGIQGTGIKSQSICIAESDDLIHFRKSPQNPILSIDERLYDASGIAWADPFVFWNKEANSFYMLINSKSKKGIPPKNGCIGLAKSGDLKEWKVEKPFYTPNTALFLEVPELFSYRNKWYLFYSETADFCMTHYRLSDKPGGPWQMPRQGDGIDGSEFYAAKTIFDQDCRYALGWIRRKEGNKDPGQPLWGGALGVPRKLIPRGDGSLKVYYPESWKTVRKERIMLKAKSIFGKLDASKDNFKLSADGGALSMCEVEQSNFYFRCRIKINENTPYAGFIFRAEDNLAQAYRIRFDRISGKIAAHGLGVDSNGSFNTALELVQRPLNFSKKNEFKFEMFTDNDIVEVFIGEEIAMSFRAYEQSGKGFGVFVEEGKAEFKKCEFYRI